MAGLVVSSPVWLYQLWAFVAPGLHRHEKKYTYVFTAAAVPLFAGGALLSYVILPVSIKVLLSLTPGDRRTSCRSTRSSTSPSAWCWSSAWPSSCRCC